MIFRMLPPSGVPLPLSDIFAAITAIFKKDSLAAFIADLRSYFGVDHCFLTSSGRAGLSMIFQALHRINPRGREVLLPAYTSFSVPSAVVHAGLDVAVYDLEENTLSPDLASLRQAINDRTLCIVVCHLYGYPCHMDAVMEVAHEKGIPVVDDAAQAMGAIYRGRLVGTIGDVGLFSLSRGKNISTVDGGIVVTKVAAIAEQLASVGLPSGSVFQQLSIVLKALAVSLLLKPYFYWIPARLPFLKLGASLFEPDFHVSGYLPFQAELGRRMLRRLSTINKERRETAQQLMRRLEQVANFVHPVPGAEPVFLRLPFFLKNGRMVRVPEKGITSSYPTAIHEIPALVPFVANENACPTAQHLASSLTTLPTHSYVTTRDIAAIADLLSA